MIGSRILSTFPPTPYSGTVKLLPSRWLIFSVAFASMLPVIKSARLCSSIVLDLPMTEGPDNIRQKTPGRLRFARFLADICD